MRYTFGVVRWAMIGVAVGAIQVVGWASLNPLLTSAPSYAAASWYEDAEDAFVFLSTIVFPFVGGYIGQADLADLRMKRILVWTSVGCLAGTIASLFLFSVQTWPFGNDWSVVFFISNIGYWEAYGLMGTVAFLVGAILTTLVYVLEAGAFAFVGAATQHILWKRGHPLSPLPAS